MKSIEIEHLTVSAGDRMLLSIPSAAFEEGSIYGIVGPSGAGKSTFLRVLNFLEKPHSGTLSFFGHRVDLTSLSHSKRLHLQRQMAFVAQKPVMFQTTVFENVALGLSYRRVAQSQKVKLVREALELVGLAAAEGRKATSLSGGEAQRIAIARALVLQPKLLLLDEPTSNLDPPNVFIIEQIITRIRQESSMTILMVTHHLQQAKRLSEYCLFLYQGQIVEQNVTQAFFESPQSEALQDFISGKMIY
ncbi:MULTISPECIES: ATP-binding cassette domain-containing protein [unclassified Paenibacillus]|uniref:ATP-binding cassette domain-containing protein n=1 Tax=unclassified Paenibacillus TaxID=185978 RepID=UPI001AE12050|nr:MULTISPECIES: ATP-binding cassette domain-containing protein [unclassified Paenibacillus]MBP1154935.1 tungstate transport system ATP-binding protein [Paenibacillus sp. PvP091]MBP1169681.1 tungstate transport system ATP-binding protein [Paenibacillus sp. PvR098]MBP2440709.1 tungstate transport system ATP-binding protein [Paenibacillus sp. PvP052]